MKPLRDIRQERTIASEAQAVADRYEFVRRMRRQVGIVYVAPPVPRRNAA